MKSSKPIEGLSDHATVVKVYGETNAGQKNEDSWDTVRNGKTVHLPLSSSNTNIRRLLMSGNRGELKGTEEQENEKILRADDSLRPEVQSLFGASIPEGIPLNGNREGGFPLTQTVTLSGIDSGAIEADKRFEDAGDGELIVDNPVVVEGTIVSCTKDCKQSRGKHDGSIKVVTELDEASSSIPQEGDKVSSAYGSTERPLTLPESSSTTENTSNVITESDSISISETNLPPLNNKESESEMLKWIAETTLLLGTTTASGNTETESEGLRSYTESSAKASETMRFLKEDISSSSIKQPEDGTAKPENIAELTHREGKAKTNELIGFAEEESSREVLSDSNFTDTKTLCEATKANELLKGKAIVSEKLTNENGKTSTSELIRNETKEAISKKTNLNEGETKSFVKPKRHEKVSVKFNRKGVETSGLDATTGTVQDVTERTAFRRNEYLTTRIIPGDSSYNKEEGMIEKNNRDNRKIDTKLNSEFKMDTEGRRDNGSAGDEVESDVIDGTVSGEIDNFTKASVSESIMKLRSGGIPESTKVGKEIRNFASSTGLAASGHTIPEEQKPMKTPISKTSSIKTKRNKNSTMKNNVGHSGGFKKVGAVELIAQGQELPVTSTTQGITQFVDRTIMKSSQQFSTAETSSIASTKEIGKFTKIRNAETLPHNLTVLGNTMLNLEVSKKAIAVAEVSQNYPTASTFMQIITNPSETMVSYSISEESPKIIGTKKITRIGLSKLTGIALIKGKKGKEEMTGRKFSKESGFEATKESSEAESSKFKQTENEMEDGTNSFSPETSLTNRRTTVQTNKLGYTVPQFNAQINPQILTELSLDSENFEDGSVNERSSSISTVPGSAKTIKPVLLSKVAANSFAAESSSSVMLVGYTTPATFFTTSESESNEESFSRAITSVTTNGFVESQTATQEMLKLEERKVITSVEKGKVISLKLNCNRCKTF